jgi:hypothetical protein
VHPDVEVIIYGDGESVADTCEEMGVRHVPDVPCSSSGVPFFNGIVEHAKVHARHDLQCYLNCDILLTPHIINALSCMTFSHFLVVGQRIDLSEGVELHISPNWKHKLEKLVDKGLAVLHAPSGIDYFIFRRGMWNGLLPIVIGRAGYDGALLAFCLRHRIPIIDGTFAIPALHQFHDYGHVPGLKNEVWRGKDAADNILLHGIKHGTPLISDAVWLIGPGGQVKKIQDRGCLRRLELALRFTHGLNLCGLVVRVFSRITQLSSIYVEKPRDIVRVTSMYY